MRLLVPARCASTRPNPYPSRRTRYAGHMGTVRRSVPAPPDTGFPAVGRAGRLPARPAPGRRSRASPRFLGPRPRRRRTSSCPSTRSSTPWAASGSATSASRRSDRPIVGSVDRPKGFDRQFRPTRRRVRGSLGADRQRRPPRPAAATGFAVPHRRGALRARRSPSRVGGRALGREASTRTSPRSSPASAPTRRCTRRPAVEEPRAPLPRARLPPDGGARAGATQRRRAIRMLGGGGSRRGAFASMQDAAGPPRPAGDAQSSGSTREYSSRS